MVTLTWISDRPNKALSEPTTGRRTHRDWRRAPGRGKMAPGEAAGQNEDAEMASAEHSGDYLAAVLQVMIVMMVIDRDLDTAEVDALRNHYQRLTGERPDDAAIQTAIDNASVEATSAHLRAMVRTTTLEQRQTVVRAALTVALADGNMRDVEHEYVTLVARDVLLGDDEIRAIWETMSP